MDLPGAKPPPDRSVVVLRMPLAQPRFLESERVLAEASRHRELRLDIEPREDPHLLGVGAIRGAHDECAFYCPIVRSARTTALVALAARTGRDGENMPE